MTTHTFISEHTRELGKENGVHKLLAVIDHAPLFRRESTQLTDA